MSKVDQFESRFKRAARTLYEHRPVPLSSVLVLTDLQETEASAFAARVKSFLRVLPDEEAGVEWTLVPGSGFNSVRTLLDLVASESPDLVVTYRSLHSQAWPWTYTLGRYVDVLAQEARMPVLLLPNPHAEKRSPESFPSGPRAYEKTGTKCVMALTDHLTGEHRLVSFGARFTQAKGQLVLAHVEDGRIFERYLDAISKIASIETENAREAILEQLLKEPHDYVASCTAALRQAGLPITLEEVVTVGHRLSEVRRLVEAHGVDLLVLSTKDQDQLAMHGLAYPLVVELRHVPILMI